MNHGRLKVEISDDEKAKQREKVRTGFSLFEELLKQRHAKIYTEKMFEATSQALAFNPEFSTLWNYRREILEHLFLAADIYNLLQKELKLLNASLKKAHKAYSVWHHRCWVLQRLLPLQKDDLIGSELELVDRMLEVDERNFHCWNYRAFLIKCVPEKRADDAAMSEKMINRNFSNYSAWHLRSTLLDPPPVAEETEWLMQAIYTEPTDQSIWMYYGWLHLDRFREERWTHSFEREGHIYLVFNRPLFGINAVLSDGKELPFEVLTFGSMRAKTPTRIGRCIRIDAKETTCPFTVVTDAKTFICGAVRSDNFDEEAWSDIYTESVDDDVKEMENLDAFLDVEPESKYAILAKTRLVWKRYLGSQIEFGEKEQQDRTEQLKALDPLRKEYYEENRQNVLMVVAIRQWYRRNREMRTVSPLDLSNMGSFQTHASALAGVRELTIRGNGIMSLGFAELLFIGAHCEVLDASDNEINQDLTTILQLLPRIRSLTLANNRISWSGKELPQVEYLDLRGNPCEGDPRLINGVYGLR